jgi:hypothetical protein
MSGLILLFALIVCFWLGIKLVRWVGQLVPNPKWKGPVEVMVALLLTASPFVDELIGWYQFNALCKANGIESADISKATGRHVRLEVGKRNSLKGLITPGAVEDWYYRDAENNEVLIQHKGYYVFGGWVMRYTPLNMGSRHPMLFSGTCFSDYVSRNQIFAKHGIILVN